MSMTKIHHRCDYINAGPLFAWAAQRDIPHRPTPYAVRWIGVRFRVPPRRAALIANLAGFPVEAQL